MPYIDVAFDEQVYTLDLKSDGAIQKSHELLASDRLKCHYKSAEYVTRAKGYESVLRGRLAIAYAIRGELIQARKEMQHALQIAPSSEFGGPLTDTELIAFGTIYLAIIEYLLGDATKALQLLESVSHPDWLGSSTSIRGRILLEQGDADQGIKLLRLATQQGEDILAKEQHALVLAEAEAGRPISDSLRIDAKIMLEPDEETG